jgi:hypothetical protein
VAPLLPTGKDKKVLTFFYLYMAVQMLTCWQSQEKSNNSLLWHHYYQLEKTKKYCYWSHGFQVIVVAPLKGIVLFLLTWSTV